MIQLSLVNDILLLFCNLQFLLFVFVLELLLNDLGKEAIDNSLINSGGQESSNTCSMENVCSETRTVHSQSDRSDVTILEKNEDVKPTISEILIVHESDACELPEDIIALRNHYNEARAMEYYRSVVTILEKNENIKPEVNEIVLTNESDLFELLRVDNKQNINTPFHESNSMASIEVKNVFSLCKNISDWKV